MADEIRKTLITELAEDSSAVDTDLFVVGDQGGSTLRKMTFANLAAAIKDKLAAWTFSALNTTSKTLTGAVNELNTNATNTLGVNLSTGAVKYNGANSNADNITNVFSLGAGTNYPSQAMYYVITFAYQGISSGNRKQIAIPYATTASNIFYTRYYNGTSWSNWIESSNLDVKAGTLTQASGQSLSSSLTIRQSGHVVAVFGFINNASVPTTATTDIATISGVSLPANAVRAVGSVGSNAYSMGTPAIIVVGSDGKITLRSSATGSGLSIFFNATWIV